MAKINTYLVFIVQGFNKQEGEHLSDICNIELIDTSADNAIKRAKKLLKKKTYRISDIIEKEKNDTA